MARAAARDRTDPTDPADHTAEAFDSDSQPERRWPMQDGLRVAGPHCHDGRFERSSSSSTNSSDDACDNVEGTDDEANAELDEEMGEEEDATSDGSCAWSDWSDTSLILENEELVQAREMFLGLYRQHLSATMLLSNREQGGRVGGMRRRLSSRNWVFLQEEARRTLQGEQLAQWQTYEFRHTHERRHRRRRPSDMDS